MRFKLLAGDHIQADPDYTGEGRAPSRTYHQGATVESDEDLEEKHGSEKFRRLDGKKKETADEDDS